MDGVSHAPAASRPKLESQRDSHGPLSRAVARRERSLAAGLFPGSKGLIVKSAGCWVIESITMLISPASLLAKVLDTLLQRHSQQWQAESETRLAYGSSVVSLQGSGVRGR